MIEGLQKSVPIVLIVCPFVEKYSKQLVDFKDVCVFYVCIFLLLNNIELPAGYFACSDLDYVYKQDSKFNCSLLYGCRRNFKSIYPIDNK